MKIKNELYMFGPKSNDSWLEPLIATNIIAVVISGIFAVGLQSLVPLFALLWLVTIPLAIGLSRGNTLPSLDYNAERIWDQYNDLPDAVKRHFNLSIEQAIEFGENYKATMKIQTAMQRADAAYRAYNETITVGSVDGAVNELETITASYEAQVAGLDHQIEA